MKHYMITKNIGISLGALDGVIKKSGRSSLTAFVGIYTEKFINENITATYFIIFFLRLIILRKNKL